MTTSLTELANAQQLAALLPFTRVAVVLFTAHWSPESDHARDVVARAANHLHCHSVPIFEVPLRTHVLHLQPHKPSALAAAAAGARPAGGNGMGGTPTARAFWNLAAPRHRRKQQPSPSPSPVRWSLPWLPSVNLFTNVTADPFVPHTYNDSFDARALARHIDSFCFSALSRAAAAPNPTLSSVRAPRATAQTGYPAPRHVAAQAAATAARASPRPTVFAPRPRAAVNASAACTPPPAPSVQPSLSDLAVTRDAFARALSGGAARAALVISPGGLHALVPAVGAALGAAAAAGWRVAVSDADAEPALAAWVGHPRAIVLADGAGDRLSVHRFGGGTDMATVSALLRAFADGRQRQRRRQRQPRRRRGASWHGRPARGARFADGENWTGVPARRVGWGASHLANMCAARADASTWVFVTAPWCAYCQRVMPEAQALRRAASAVAGVDVRFVPLDRLDGLPRHARDLVDGVPTVLRVRAARGWVGVEEYVGPHDVRAMAEFHDEKVAALLRERLPHDGG